jgi:4-hydroxy-tetrahydrodipicolinate reductase
MNRIKLMVNGLPGNMAQNVIKYILDDRRFELILKSLTGPEITDREAGVHGVTFGLIQPRDRDRAILALKDKEGPFLSVDYSHPTAVNANAEFYCRNELPFVMGTTGGDRQNLEKTVLASSIPAVIAPNMAKQIVGFQAMMEYTADTFPDLFKG